MWKMKKNSKGFVLVETLVVTAFVAAVFSVIYINFYPLVGEYERRDFYDDLDSKYGAYWMKVFIQRGNFEFSSVSSAIQGEGQPGYYYGDVNDFCGHFPDGSNDKNFCFVMAERLHVDHVIITRYRLDDSDGTTANFKLNVMNDTSVSESFRSYIEYLPDFIVASLNTARYRVLVEFKRPTGNSDDEEPYYTYSNMEVIR